MTYLLDRPLDDELDTGADLVQRVTDGPAVDDGPRPAVDVVPVVASAEAEPQVEGDPEMGDSVGLYLREISRVKLLTAEEADAWLRGLNDLRLVLGTRLDVTEETDFELELDSGERGRELAVYGYLTWLQEQFVEALSPE